MASRRILKSVSLTLVNAFILQQIAFAAPEIKPFALPMFSTPRVSFVLPESVALIEDAYKAAGSRNDKTLILIQDAHTNASAQMNIAKAIDAILTGEKDLKYIFLEAGEGSDSLSYFRQFATAEKRADAAASFVKKGIFNGAEYLDITSDKNFTLWGVEDKQLYFESLDAYKTVAESREKFLNYLSRVETAAEALKTRLYNPSLQAFDKSHQKFLKEEISLTDYFAFLSAEAMKLGIDHSRYPAMKKLSELKSREEKIDFKRATDEQIKAVAAMSEVDQAELIEIQLAQTNRSPFKLSTADHKEEKAYFAVLKEKIGKDAAKYPELSKYFDYLKEARSLEAKDVLAEEKSLEDAVYALLSKTEDERRLVLADSNQRLLKKLFNLTLSPEEFDAYKKDSANFDITRITGFLNKKIMDEKSLYERAIFLEQGYEEVVKKAEDFYVLTHDRNEAFVSNLFAKMDEDKQTKAILVSGGFHTPGLKELLKAKGVSYICVTPQVPTETNLKKYEEILLSRNNTSEETKLAQAPSKTTQNAIAPTLGGQIAAEVDAFGLEPAFGISNAYEAVLGARLADSSGEGPSVPSDEKETEAYKAALEAEKHGPAMSAAAKAMLDAKKGKGVENIEHVTDAGMVSYPTVVDAAVKKAGHMNVFGGAKKATVLPGQHPAATAPRPVIGEPTHIEAPGFVAEDHEMGILHTAEGDLPIVVSKPVTPPATPNEWPNTDAGVNHEGARLANSLRTKFALPNGLRLRDAQAAYLVATNAAYEGISIKLKNARGEEIDMKRDFLLFHTLSVAQGEWVELTLVGGSKKLRLTAMTALVDALKSEKEPASADEPAGSRLAQDIYFFGAEQTEGNGKMKKILGGKGANLAEMAVLGMPVPPGFTITTDVARAYFKNNNSFPDGLKEQIDAALVRLETVRGKKLGDPADPLLVSVRSGAELSMPGMMDTILNLGLTDASVVGLANKTNNPRFAWNSYARLLEMYGDVVLGVDRENFTHITLELKKRKGLSKEDDAGLTAEDFQYLAGRFKALIASAGQVFPQDAKEQLYGATEAVFRSSNNERANVYRRLNGISPDVVSAVNVQSMVFGNTGDNSATGVAFTRNVSTGETGFNGEWLVNAQGEDVVAGIRTPLKLDELKRKMPAVYEQLVKIADVLEKHNKDAQDMEFTIEDGTLYMLQTRNAKRTAAAMLRIAVELAEEGMITREQAIERVDLARIEKELMHPVVDEKAAKKAKLLGKAVDASPGAAVGRIVFDSKTAEEWAKRGEKVILVRVETSPDDLGGMVVSQGILTAQGGSTSHAALVARGQGIPAVVGFGALEINIKDKIAKVNEDVFKEGDSITIDGSTGRIFAGEVPTRESEIEQVQNGKLAAGESAIYQKYLKLLEWADFIRRLGVWTNADQPADAKKARELGAEGIGLTRTEHMFMKPERVPFVQAMFLSKEGSPERAKVLEQIAVMQQGDFEGILEAMDGLPVTIRLLDPPMHEFLPKHDDPNYAERVQDIASQLGVTTAEVESRIAKSHESNPMIGMRGVRLLLVNPSIMKMQATAMVRAFKNLKDRGLHPKLKIMVPNIIDVKEFIEAKAAIRAVMKNILGSETDADIQIGTMIEMPSAALTADEIAKEADFFSFGTNDLTQMTFGMSRDDAAKTFLQIYLEKGIFKADPTQKLDAKSVFRLIKMAVTEGRGIKPELLIGICGEHGGNPESIELFDQAGLTYVSASPLRVPIARLAAAQSTLKARKTGARLAQVSGMDSDPEFQNPFLHTFLGKGDGNSRLEKAAKAGSFKPEQVATLRDFYDIYSVPFNGKLKDLNGTPFGLRVKHSIARGPGKGGIRFIFAPDLTGDEYFMSRFNRLITMGATLEDLRHFLRTWIQQETQALALGMTIKNSVTDLPYGGAKGSVLFADVFPDGKGGFVIHNLTGDDNKARQALQNPANVQIVDAYARNLYDAGKVGAAIDVPAPDVNSGGFMDRMVEQGLRIHFEEMMKSGTLGQLPASFLKGLTIAYEANNGGMLPYLTGYLKNLRDSGAAVPQGVRPFVDALATFTAKSMENGGAEFRNEATGYGVVYVLSRVLELKGKTVKVHGYGNVAKGIIDESINRGAKVIAISDDANGIVRKSGGFTKADIEVLNLIQKENKGSLKALNTKPEYAIAGAVLMKDEKSFLELEADIFTPALRENVITGENAGLLKARVIAEGANGPLTNEAYQILTAKGVEIIPDSVANVGGVTVSMYEWEANLANRQDSFETNKARLEKDLADAVAGIQAVQRELKTDFRTATDVYALRKVLAASAGARLATRFDSAEGKAIIDELAKDVRQGRTTIADAKLRVMQLSGVKSEQHAYDLLNESPAGLREGARLSTATVEDKLRADFPKLFEVKDVNGRMLDPLVVIEALTESAGPNIPRALNARRELLESTAPVREKYAFPKWDDRFTDADGASRSFREIIQGLLDNFNGVQSDVRWGFNEEVAIPDDIDPLKKPGLQITGPSALDMAMKQYNADLSVRMPDLEDASEAWFVPNGAPKDRKVGAFQGIQNEAEIFAGDWDGKAYVKGSKTYTLTQPREKRPTVIQRVPSIHLIDKHILVNGQATPAIAIGYALHFLNTHGSLTKNGSGNYYYQPKIQTPEEALIVEKMLMKLEELTGLKRGTIKLEMLYEEGNAGRYLPVITWVFRHRLIGSNVGRWDYIGSLIEMWKNDPAGVFPDPQGINMNSPNLITYQRFNALINLMAGMKNGKQVNGAPIGGMAAVMLYSPGDDFGRERNNPKALRMMFIDKLRERLLGLVFIPDEPLADGVQPTLSDILDGKVKGRLYDTYRQSWVATPDKEYVAAGNIALRAELKNLQAMLDAAVEGIDGSTDPTVKGFVPKVSSGLIPVERQILQTRSLPTGEPVRLLNADGKITPWVIAPGTLSKPEQFINDDLWKNLYSVPKGEITPENIQHAFYMSAEYGFQILNGNYAAAIDDYTLGLRFMNDLATYRIFVGWLWTLYYHRAKTTKDGYFMAPVVDPKLGVIPGDKEHGVFLKAGTELTPELFEKMWTLHNDRTAAFFKDFDARGKKSPFDRKWAPVIMDVLKHQFLSEKYLQHSPRVLFALAEADETQRKYIIDAIFSPREKTEEALLAAFADGSRQEEGGHLKQELYRHALEVHDYVFDYFPQSVIDTDHDGGPLAAVGTTGGARLAATVMDEERAQIKSIADFMSAPRFQRIAKNRNWTAEEIYRVVGRVTDDHALHNYLAQKLFDALQEMQDKKSGIDTGGAMDGPTAAAMAEASASEEKFKEFLERTGETAARKGLRALYFSGWMMSHHWGQPDLAKYPLDTVPNRIEMIYKFLQNKDQDQQTRFKAMRVKLQEVFSDMFRDIRDSEPENLAALKKTYLERFSKIAGGDMDIFLDDVRFNPDIFHKGMFEKIIDQAIEDKSSTTQEKRDALREAVYSGLQAQLVDYLIPIYADGDTGHQSVKEMIRLFVKANAAGIHIEDQLHGAKKCGHMAGKVLVSVREHFMRLIEARKEADKVGSKIVIIARTDAEAAKLLATNEDPRDHYFIIGTTETKLPSLPYIIRLWRREVFEFDNRGDNAAVIAELTKLMPGVSEEEIHRILSTQTPEMLVDQLAASYPDLAEMIRQGWGLRGLDQGKRIEPNDVFRIMSPTGQLISEHNAAEVWDMREQIEFKETAFAMDTVLTDEKGGTMTVRELLGRKPVNIAKEIAALERLTELWGQKAKLKTYAKAVSEAILAGDHPDKVKLEANWRKATDPLKNTLSIDQLRALAKVYGVKIDWDWEKARTYEGFYQIDSKQGVLNASVRMRAYGRIADVGWMEQDGPNEAHSAELAKNVDSDPGSHGMFLALNLSPSFNWSLPKNWKSTLGEARVARIEKAMQAENFDWDMPETWGDTGEAVKALTEVLSEYELHQLEKAMAELEDFDFTEDWTWAGYRTQLSALTTKLSLEQRMKIQAASELDGFSFNAPVTWNAYGRDVQAMLDAINGYSDRMSALGYVFRFVTIYQDHISTMSVYQISKKLAALGAAGFVRFVQQMEQRIRSRFEKHQTAAGVKRVESEDDLINRGASATGAAGKASTEHQFGKAKAAGIQQLRSAEKTVGTTLVRISEGEITEVKADAVLIPSNPDFNSNPGVVAAVVTKLGDQRGQALFNDAKASLPNATLGSAVAVKVRRGFWKYVIHAVNHSLPTYETSMELVTTSTLRALEEADKLGLKSVTVPAFGTGTTPVLSFAESAQAILEAVRQFSGNGQQKLERIEIVLNTAGAYDEFKKVLDASFGARLAGDVEDRLDQIMDAVNEPSDIKADMLQYVRANLGNDDLQVASAARQTMDHLRKVGPQTVNALLGASPLFNETPALTESYFDAVTARLRDPLDVSSGMIQMINLGVASSRLRIHNAAVAAAKHVVSVKPEASDFLHGARLATLDDKINEEWGVPADLQAIAGSQDRVEAILMHADLSDVPAAVRENLRAIYEHGILAGTGQAVILPIDQGLEHSPIQSWAANRPAADKWYQPMLARTAGMSAYAAPYGTIKQIAPVWAKRLPLIAKINNSVGLVGNDKKNQMSALSGNIEELAALGVRALGFTIYGGSLQWEAQIAELKAVVAEGEKYGLPTIVWSYPRGGDMPAEHETALDVTIAAVKLAVEAGAHVVKIKPPANVFRNPVRKAWLESQKWFIDGKYDLNKLEDRIKIVTLFANGRELIFSGGPAKAEDEVLDEIARILLGNGGGNIVGRNLFKRPFEKATPLALKIMALNLAKSEKSFDRNDVEGFKRYAFENVLPRITASQNVPASQPAFGPEISPDGQKIEKTYADDIAQMLDQEFAAESPALKANLDKLYRTGVGYVLNAHTMPIEQIVRDIAGGYEGTYATPVIAKITPRAYYGGEPRSYAYPPFLGQMANLAKIGVTAVGYTLNPDPGPAYNAQVTELTAIIKEAKKHGIATVVWSYPIGDKSDALDITTTATQVALELGAHVVIVKDPTAEFRDAKLADKKELDKAGIPYETPEQRRDIVKWFGAFGDRRQVIFTRPDGSYFSSYAPLSETRQVIDKAQSLLRTADGLDGLIQTEALSTRKTEETLAAWVQDKNTFLSQLEEIKDKAQRAEIVRGIESAREGLRTDEAVDALDEFVAALRGARLAFGVDKAWFEANKAKIVPIFISGGEGPGVNDYFARAAQALEKESLIPVMVKKGIDGLTKPNLNEQVAVITPEIGEQMLGVGGVVAGTSRVKLAKEKPEVIRTTLRNMTGFAGLLAIGGGDHAVTWTTFISDLEKRLKSTDAAVVNGLTAADVEEFKGLMPGITGRMITALKTIDGDWSRQSLGFHTAWEEGQKLVYSSAASVHLGTAKSQVAVIDVMGENVGRLAVMSASRNPSNLEALETSQRSEDRALAAKIKTYGPSVITIIPEVPVSLRQIVDAVRETRTREGSALVVVAEGFRFDANDELLKKMTDPAGPDYDPEVLYAVQKMLEAAAKPDAHGNVKAVLTKPNLVIAGALRHFLEPGKSLDIRIDGKISYAAARGTEPHLYDRLYAQLLGTKVGELFRTKQFGVFVSLPPDAGGWTLYREDAVQIQTFAEVQTIKNRIGNYHALLAASAEELRAKGVLVPDGFVDQFAEKRDLLRSLQPAGARLSLADIKQFFVAVAQALNPLSGSQIAIADVEEEGRSTVFTYQRQGSAITVTSNSETSGLNLNFDLKEERAQRSREGLDHEKDALSLQSIRTAEEALKQKLLQDLAGLSLELGQEGVIEFAGYVSDKAEAVEIEHLIGVAKSLRAQSYGKQLFFDVDSDAVRTAVLAHPEAQGLFVDPANKSMVNFLKPSPKVRLATSEAGFKKGVINLLVQKPVLDNKTRKGDIPATEAIAIFAAHIVKSGLQKRLSDNAYDIPTPIQNGFNTLSNEKATTEIQSGIFLGTIQMAKALKFALKAIMAVDINTAFKYWSMRIKQFAQSA